MGNRLLHPATLALFLAAGLLVGASALRGEKAAPQPPTAEKDFRNIRVLTGLPSAQLLPVMHFMRSSLGVTCDYCHVAERDQYYRDDKPAKQRARQMISMVMDLNQRNFGGRPVVTCNTCHRGSVAPVAIPPITQGVFPDTTRAAAVPPPPPLPDAAQIARRYIEAIGGPSAIERLTTRTARMTMLRAAIVDDKVAPPRAVNRGASTSMEIFQQAPDRLLRIVTTPAGVTRQLLVGARGWVQTPQGWTEVTAADVKRLSSDWELNLHLRRELDLRSDLAAARVSGIETVAGRPAYVVEMAGAGQSARQKLYFDTASGLLVRRLVLRPLPFGEDPEQTDYTDYRRVGGLRLPFRVTTSYLDDNHLGTTRIYSAVNDNVAVSPSLFEPPR